MVEGKARGIGGQGKRRNGRYGKGWPQEK